MSVQEFGETGVFTYCLEVSNKSECSISDVSFIISQCLCAHARQLHLFPLGC
jgi:hypothetical protein